MNKYDRYIELMKAEQDSHGFIQSSHCDSTLFSGLIGCLPEVNVDLTAAFIDGFWHRRSNIHKPCFDMEQNVGNGSASSISRDMLLGVAYWCWYNKRGDVAEQIVVHAMKHMGFMGKAEDLKALWGRTQILPGLFATFCWISYKLGGPCRWWAMWIPADSGHKTDNYAAHLQILHILLRKEIAGFTFWFENAILKYHVNRQPLNPLYHIAVGDYEKASRILDERIDWWPDDRLPTNFDRETEWIPMRDSYEKGWNSISVKPGRKVEQVHSGGDYLFCKWLINKGIK